MTHDIPRRATLGLLTGALAAGTALAQPAVGTDPLPSWRPGPRRDALLRFVAEVTREGAPGFVPLSERIAVFDNDGTLWVEQPAYTQLLFAMDRARDLAPQNPAWRDDPLFRAAIAGDLATVAATGMEGILRLVGATHAGMAPDAFQAIVARWLDTARDRRWGRPYTALIYQPMVELLAFLRANGFATFIVSGGGVEFIRAFAQHAYGVPPSQVVGTTVALRPGEQDGRITLTREPHVDFVDDGPGKPVGISRHIGQRPIAAFGNSDGDYQMLRFVTEGPGPRFGMIVHHDDAAREYAYDRDSHVGRLARAMDEAPARGWHLVSMRDDWSRIFP
jgi:phosphoserine phosphatase